MIEPENYKDLIRKHREVEIRLREFLSEFNIHPREVIIWTDENGHSLATTQDPYGIFSVYPDGLICPEHIPENKPSDSSKDEKDSQA